MKDKQTLQELYERFSPMVYRRCYSMLKDEQMAKDCMHDVFIKVHEKWHDLNFKYPSSLLYTMATNHVLNTIRDNKSNVSDEILNVIADAHCTLEIVNNKSLISKILRLKDENTGVMAVMHYADGWRVEDVAKHFGISITAVRKRLKRLQEVAKREFPHE